MNARLIAFLFVLIVTTFTLFGCKGKVEKTSEVPIEETQDLLMPEEEVVTEPAQTVTKEVADEPQPIQQPQVMSAEKIYDKKDIQKALKNAGCYAGEIDGIFGPQTKKAIMEFQAANGLEADGKVGPKTWAKLQQHLGQ